MNPYKNRPKIIKGDNGVKTDDTVATFGLPEVNVYPNNRWGDIARSQGLETARNWRKVKEGTTKGINDFANDPRTQFVLSIAPMPSGFEGAETAARMIANSVKSAAGAAKPYIINTALNLTHNSDARVVANRFRNREYLNFLQTINGDNYYRLQKDLKLSSRMPHDKLFISHTTPWNEFVEAGIADPSLSAKELRDLEDAIAKSTPNLKLIEIPTKALGERLSTNYLGNFTNHKVSELGRLHLNYGNSASSKRDFVRVLSDKTAKFLGESSYKMGIVDRPLKPNGLYDTRPIYEDIKHGGNQTVIPRQLLRDALSNFEYNTYEPVEGGIQKIIHIPEK